MTYDTETVDVELTVTLIEYIATQKPVCVLHYQHFSWQDGSNCCKRNTVSDVSTMQDGAVLVFVPGWEDISKINDKLQARSLFKSGSWFPLQLILSSCYNTGIDSLTVGVNSTCVVTGSFRIIPLHSLMPTVNQREVFDKPPDGVRKIIIATNIAETRFVCEAFVTLQNINR